MSTRQKVVWAEPRNITSISDCYFYHTMDIPNHGIVRGEWDLRGRENSYLGNVNLHGKRVLEVGTASGYLCFTMEKMGADVVAYDLSDKQEWDIVPYAGYDYGSHISNRREHMRRINNGYWFAHRSVNSHAKVVYGTVYEIPEDIGEFDICTFGSILLHLRDPFLALQRVLAHVKETVVVTDVAPVLRGNALLAGNRYIEFLPNSRYRQPTDGWWNLSPELVSEFLHILGFEYTKISFHRQLRGNDREVQLYTVIGQRKCDTLPSASAEKESCSGGQEAKNRSILDEVTLQNMKYSRIAKHLLRRGIRSLPKKLMIKR